MPSALAVRALFAARVVASRESIEVAGKPMTKAEFVRRLNVEAETAYNEGNVRLWEKVKGKAMPHARVIPSIAVVLGVTTDYLLGLTDDPEPTAARAAAAVARRGP